MRALYHFTCDHGRRGINGTVIPATFQDQRFIGTPGEYAWFTDLAIPIRDALGLTSTTLSCDRTKHRYRVLESSAIHPWTEARRTYSWGADLERAPGARPMHWFVATEAVSVVYDPIVAKAAS